MFSRTKTADAIKEKRRTAWPRQRPVLMMSRVYVCKCTCVCFHLCAPVCATLCLLLVLGNAEPHFLAQTFRSRLQHTKMGLKNWVTLVMCSYQLVMRFKWPVIVSFQKKIPPSQLFLVHLRSPKQSFQTFWKCKFSKGLYCVTFWYLEWSKTAESSVKSHSADEFVSLPSDLNKNMEKVVFHKQTPHFNKMRCLTYSFNVAIHVKGEKIVSQWQRLLRRRI